MATLDREEYIEQAYFFRVLGERMRENIPIQDLLATIRDEVLATTNLPLAIDFLLSELRHSGVIGSAMATLGHYFHAFQTYTVQEAESERGRFDMRVALDLLRREADYRGQPCSPQGLFLYQFEALCRNRLRYDAGLTAMAEDPVYDEDWRQWILTVRRQVGMVDLADLIYVRSEHYRSEQSRRGVPPSADQPPALFGPREGKISVACRHKDPLMLFSALQRQLGYPPVPRPKEADSKADILPQLSRRVGRMEARLKFLEDEQRGGIDLTKFYGPPPERGAGDGP